MMILAVKVLASTLLVQVSGLITSELLTMYGLKIKYKVHHPFCVKAPIVSCMDADKLVNYITNLQVYSIMIYGVKLK